MDPADLSGLPALLVMLAEATLAGSAAVGLVLVLRRPLRHAFGATVAYAAWALVPAALVAVALPAATETAAAVPVAILMSGAVAPLATVPVAAPFDAAPWLLAAWLAGALVMALHLGRQQRAFLRGLGRLQPRADGLQQAESVAGLPAAVGLLRPAIVVPADFDTRYSGEERALMHAHERSHIARGDLHLNALVALLRSVFWFNPLLHHAVRHFRHDQELACDQRVIARHPHGRRAYGEAMFKTQLASQPLPLGCHWAVFDQARNHPLKERIAMLKQPTPTAARWIGGGIVVIVLALGVGFSAWSAQPKREVIGAGGVPAGMLMTRMELSIDGGEPEQFEVIAKAGERFAMRGGQAGRRWEVQGTASPQGDGTVALATTLSRDGKVLASPNLVVREGKKAAIEIGETNAATGEFSGIALNLVVTTGVGMPPTPPAPPAPRAAMIPSPAAPPVPMTNATAAVAPLPPAASPVPPAPPQGRLAPPPPPLPPAPASAPAPALAPAPVIAPAAPHGVVDPKARPAPAPPSMGGVNRTPAPKYPAAAIAQKIGGKVVLEIDIDATGKPTNVEVVQSEPMGIFDQTTIDTARQWRFKPEMENGKPVPGRVRVPVEFAPTPPAAAEDKTLGNRS